MSNQTRTFSLRKIAVLTYDSLEDKMVEVLGLDKKPAIFSYKPNLFNLLRASPEGRHKKIKDVMQTEELIQRLIATPAGSEILLTDAEHLLIKESFEAQDYPMSSAELKQMYVDVLNAPVIEYGSIKKD